MSPLLCLPAVKGEALDVWLADIRKMEQERIEVRR
jgi:hypothetical protein